MAKRKKLKIQTNVKDTRIIKQRDFNILAGIRGECQLKTQISSPNKKIYSRKKINKNINNY